MSTNPFRPLSLRSRRNRSDSIRPLYDHTSESTAYLVEDYPYGFKLRTQIRYWLEQAPKKGWRFVSQTMNPKTGRWNAPKKSTYADIGGAMYLDEKGHVAWEGLGHYTSAQQALDFLTRFPQAETQLKAWARAKVRYLDDMISGRKVWTINGVPKPPTPGELEKHREERALWDDVATRAR